MYYLGFFFYNISQFVFIGAIGQMANAVYSCGIGQIFNGETGYTIIEIGIKECPIPQISEHCP